MYTTEPLMPQQTPSLCAVCRRLDVQAILLAAEAAPLRPDFTYRDGFPSASRELITHDATYTSYRHHKSLTTLKHSAEQCDLCSAIWNDFCRHRQPHELTPGSLTLGRADTHIYIGTSAWNTSASAVPHVVASQLTLDGRDNVTLASFEACADYGTLPLPNDHLLARVQASSAADDQCFTLAQNWLKDCREKHSACRNAYQSAMYMPTRLLNVGLDADGVLQPNALVRLVQGQHCKGSYAALSYCWGPDRDFLLTHQSEAALRQGFNMSDMPGSLRDAVIVARRTGIPYVWIDALCIYQDQQEFQESRDDWARESGRMHDVYRNAVVTIEAASASRANEGFLTTRKRSQLYCAVPWGRGQQVYLRPASEVSEHKLYGSTIYSRGWTMQERLLAPRTLSFGESQMSFECANGFIDEAGRPSKASCGTAVHLSKCFVLQIRKDRGGLKSRIKSICQTAGASDISRIRGVSSGAGLIVQSLIGHLTRPNGTSQSYYDYWAELVTRFSERQFTNHADRLPALSGLADEFQATLCDKYICGLWKSRLVSSLSWSCAKVYNPALWQDYALPGYESQDYRSPVAFAPAGTWPDTIKLTQYVAPSWSWASVIGIIEQPAGSFGTFDAKVMDVQVTPQYSTDPHGRAASGYLVLSAKFLPLPDPFVPYESGSHYRLSTVHAQIHHRDVVALNDYYATEAYQHHVPYVGQQFALIQLWKSPPCADRSLGGSVMMLLIESCEPEVSKAQQQQEWRRLCRVSISLEESTREAYLAAHMLEDDDQARADFLGQVWQKGRQVTLEIQNAKWERRRVRLV